MYDFYDYHVQSREVTGNEQGGEKGKNIQQRPDSNRGVVDTLTPGSPVFIILIITWSLVYQA